MEDITKEIRRAVIEGDKEESIRLAKKAVKEEMDLSEVIESGFIPGIQQVGELWEKGEYFLPELISSAECMKAAMNILQPEMKKKRIQTKFKARIIIGTVEGDIHDIGKNLVASVLSSYGFEVIDLGADVKLERFIEKAVEEKADFICLSALLTTTMLGQKKVIEMLAERKLRERFKVMVGGAPVNRKWAEEIGADGFGENAMAAVKAVESLIGKKG